LAKKTQNGEEGKWPSLATEMNQKTLGKKKKTKPAGCKKNQSSGKDTIFSCLKENPGKKKKERGQRAYLSSKGEKGGLHGEGGEGSLLRGGSKDVGRLGGKGL